MIWEKKKECLPILTKEGNLKYLVFRKDYEERKHNPNSLLDDKPDIVISGINEGPNLGDDVMYSGTVAAAVEGRHLKLPAIAVSLVGKEHYSTAVFFVMKILKQIEECPILV